MLRARILSLTTAAFLLGALPSIAAHGHEDMGTSMGEMDGVAVSGVDSSGGPASYFRLSEHAELMYAHIFFMTISWAVILPIGVMLSIARSRFTLPSQVLFLTANALGLFVGIAYNRQTPDLYENNAHHKVGWIITGFALSWVIVGILNTYVDRRTTTGGRSSSGRPVSAATMAHYYRLQATQPEEPSRWSGDSGQGTERDSVSLSSPSRSSSVASENQYNDLSPQRYQHLEEDEDDATDVEKRGFKSNGLVDRFLLRTVQCVGFGRRASIAMRLFYIFLERFMILFGFLAVASGAVVFGGIMRGDAIFNGMAHLVKGGIFFWYGLITLGRWMGCFADLGWAWNIKPSISMVGRWKASVPTAEFTESFVIFLYGSSNVFMEHMAAWGDEWTAQDLEHVSITIMFFGGGLLGMLIESKRVRELLNTNILASKENVAQIPKEGWSMPKHYSVPLNPLPGLVILLLGIMMSAHHQDSMTSTMVHKQWGTLFVGFALARAVTYVILYLAPPTSYLPARLPSEVISAFCLLGGGIVFMFSNKDIVAALEYNKLDAMFAFTVAMGLTCLLMAWATVLVAIKGWAIRRETGTASERL